MKKRFFVTGTDTDAGKTFVTVGLLEAAKRAGLRTMGLKPVSAGASLIDGELKNDDALQIQQACSVKMHYSQVNPIVFEPAIAPHIASQQANKLVTVSRLEGYIKGAMLTPHDFALVEGAGGWRVPLNDRELLSDLVKALDLPVILVVNMKLGCLNHAILTAESIARDSLKIAGWVANNGDLQKMSCYDENLATLKAILPAPLLSELPWCTESEKLNLEFDRILEAL
ncbi:dethiobiotin synthase [Marinomonas sp. C2222]|uniref:ATP-dependent dethiobiotin synthetase BioD n=1 Tax=Marinomonas sargassi TaxID=2984494 RepID=A0ABT2YND6_9GAMM|nr:dethiobiotin synthase [Marinomonas sargassi]MCV2401402.1 dethiobiotin synthase [Marinomonas sargassi]